MSQGLIWCPLKHKNFIQYSLVRGLLAYFVQRRHFVTCAGNLNLSLKWTTSIITVWFQLLPIWHQSIIFASKHGTDICCMLLWGTEISIITWNSKNNNLSLRMQKAEFPRKWCAFSQKVLSKIAIGIFYGVSSHNLVPRAISYFMMVNWQFQPSEIINLELGSLQSYLPQLI